MGERRLRTARGMAEESTNEMKKKEMQLGARWLVKKERTANQNWVWNRGEKEYKIYGNFHEKRVEKKIKNSVAGNRTPVIRVTGGDTSHYTTTESENAPFFLYMSSDHSRFSLPVSSPPPIRQPCTPAALLPPFRVSSSSIAPMAPYSSQWFVPSIPLDAPNFIRTPRQTAHLHAPSRTPKNRLVSITFDPFVSKKNDAAQTGKSDWMKEDVLPFHWWHKSVGAKHCLTVQLLWIVSFQFDSVYSTIFLFHPFHSSHHYYRKCPRPTPSKKSRPTTPKKTAGSTKATMCIFRWSIALHLPSLNITPILPYHKNFLKMLLEKAAEGADFEQFFKKHPERAQKKWDNLIVGQLQA